MIADKEESTLSVLYENCEVSEGDVEKDVNISFSFRVISEKKRNLEDSNSLEPPKKVLKQTIENGKGHSDNQLHYDGDQDDLQENPITYDIPILKEKPRKEIKRNSKKEKQILENEETFKTIEVKIPKVELNRTINSFIQPMNHSIQELKQQVTETKRNLKTISTPLWLLVILMVILIAIEYSKLQNNTFTQPNQPNIVYNNFTTIQPDSSSILETKKTENSTPATQTSNPTITPIEIQFISNNVNYIDSHYLKQKFTKVFSSFPNFPNVKFSFKQLKPEDGFKINEKSFFLLIHQSTRFHEEEREPILEKFVKDLPTERCAVIFICLADLIRLGRYQTMNKDVFSVKWNREVAHVDKRDEETIRKLIHKIVGEF